MSYKAIIFSAIAGIAGIATGGTAFPIIGVAAIFAAVWGISEHSRETDWDHDIRKAYPDIMAQHRPARKQTTEKRHPQLAKLANVLQ